MTRLRSMPRAFALALALLTLAAIPVPGSAPDNASTTITALAAPDPVVARFQAMSSVQKVGQLFLVAFYGNGNDPLSDISALVRDYGIGGVVLQKGNNVFTNERGEDLPVQIAQLTGRLQATALAEGGSGVPLFVAVDHEGNGDPVTHLREGFTAIPSAMAIGATWDTANAETAGHIVGQELAAVGVNLLLGPVLDVLAEPRVDSQGDIGTRAFGGDPFWVSQMGRAYIRGVHAGSSGRVATVAKHFPGHGGSDRLPDEEAPVVSKSLQELQRIELPPFARVTEADMTQGAASMTQPGGVDSSVGTTPSEDIDSSARTSRTDGGTDPAVTDAMMTSHIRYRGLQQNIRQVTPPISFDAAGLAQIFKLAGTPFAAWQDAGGIIVSDSLGVRAVKRYFDPSRESFPHRDVARRAFMAGNDLLILAQFALQDAWSAQRANITDTVTYFAAEYEADAEFHARVDSAVLKILRRKRALYPSWSAPDVVVSAEKVHKAVGTPKSRAAVGAIASQAVTVLQAQAHPERGDNIVFVTDDDGTLACPHESCGLDDGTWRALSTAGKTLVDAFALARFGERGTGLLRADLVKSITFCQLKEALSPADELPPATATPETKPTPGSGSTITKTECASPADREAILAALAGANWIVFAFADLKPDLVGRLNGFFLPAVREIALAHHDAHLGVLSFGPPYYVDRTNFNQLDACIVAYSKIPASISAAVAALFDPQSHATGASPVTILDADGYNITRQLEPDPAQKFTADVLNSDASAGRLPVHVTLGTGTILDGNGHPVPDRTVLEVSTDPPGALQAGLVQQLETAGGRATGELVFPRGGHVRILVASDPANPQPVLELNLPQPTPTSVPDRKVAAGTGSPDANAGVDTSSAPFLQAAPSGRRLQELLVTLLVILSLCAAALSRPFWRRSGLDAQLRVALLIAAAGLAVHAGFALGFTTAAGDLFWSKAHLGPLGMPLATFAGGCGGLLAGWWSVGGANRGDGSAGSMGPVGSVGTVGSVGSVGTAGSVGSAGTAGSVGSAGSTGSVGSAGSAEPLGPLSPTDASSTQGPQEAA